MHFCAFPIFMEMHKNKFSEIGLGSSKDLFYERPNDTHLLAFEIFEICVKECGMFMERGILVS